ncbi:hypothetical protein D9758_002188 [Tetrapyrgos nigripes]|uniref:RING-type domain-containing protein n=1 Tax=Tetrapyrgos nigripes TaxID=182062 RepID=A0A8H5LT95_9AGAR|nr:hypothetical protein D9758_002188 [Tetrapyrgos nigripes]
MSTREPLWYCHECNAEMRPLMVPDPVCASCHGSFVEKMENPSDDPREFHRGDLGGDDHGIDPFLMLLQNLMSRGMSPGRRSSSPPQNTGSEFSFQIRSGSNGPATFSIGGARTLGGGAAGPGGTGNAGRVPTMSEYLRRSGEGDDGQPSIAGPLMAHYLMALLGARGGPMGDIFGDAAQTGRMGDYVFNQEALDQIITQLMEQSNTSRPVPATDDIMQNLPREVLTEGSSMLEKDCAVCKEQFKLETEDPDEQVVVALPCKHPFHEPCIMPWLKSSGTCPVCRHQLVPQPEHHTPPPRDSGSRPSSPSQSRGSRSRSPGNDSDSGLLSSLFGMMSGGSRSSSNRTRHTRSTSNPESSSSNSSRDSERHLPGGWDELD